MRVLVATVAAFFAGEALALPFGYSVRSDLDDNMYRIDLATGAATLLGPTGFADVEGLAIGPTGTLYGIDDATDQLLTCSTTTGACTVVGPLGVTITDMGLSFGPDGVLYMAVDAPTPEQLFRINVATGAATAIGPQGQDVTGLAGRAGIASCPSGVFGIGGDNTNNLVCMNLTTGAATTIGPTGRNFSDGGIDFDPATGVLWGVLDTAPPSEIITINPTTGAATLVGTVSVGGGFESLAIGPVGAVAVLPVPLDRAALLLLALGLWWLARRAARSRIAAR
jgi:hypothetical protein